MDTLSGELARLFDKKINVVTIGNEVRSLAKKEELKIGSGGGEKVNGLLAGIKKSFPKRKVLKNYFLFWGAFHRKLNNVKEKL